MSSRHFYYIGFDIKVSATQSNFLGLWIAHYDIKRGTYGMASASISGLHKAKQEALDDALRIAKEFVDNVVESRC